ncbi:unnamed protein product, partial [Iphiclides podalirius]
MAKSRLESNNVVRCCVLSGRLLINSGCLAADNGDDELISPLAIAEAQKLGAQDFIRVLVEKPWDELTADSWDLPSQVDLKAAEEIDLDDNDEGISNSYDGSELKTDAGKRSAVATALNTGRRRRQPTPALGKAVTPYVGVGVLNDVGSFFDSLRDNLENLASLSPEQRSTLFQELPQVLQAQSGGMSGGGTGMRRLHALRPLKPTSNIRSFVEPDRGYPRANHHDPGLLWTGLGRR